MIDLEDALSALVERAPAPPDVAHLARRARQRRWRRRGTALTAALVVGAGLGTVVVMTSSRHAARVSVLTPTTDTVRVTLLDGSQLSISGPSSLGLAQLPQSFNAELDPILSTVSRPGHSFSVRRGAPAEPGAIVGTYPTADGHELVVSSTPIGVDAVVHYDGWALVVHWSHDPTDWAAFADALNAKETADGYLVIEPSSGWRLGPTDAPDVQLGDAFSFFGPATYRSGCEGEGHEPQWRCDPEARVRIGALDPGLAGSLDDLQVSYTDAQHAVDRITTLDGQTYEITAPASVLDHLVLQSTVAIDGVDTSTPIVVEARRGAAATSGDVAVRSQVGDWSVIVLAPGVSGTVRTRIVSLFAVRETGDGFIVLDPRAPVRVVPGPAAEIVLDGADVITSGPEPRVIVREPQRVSADEIHVRRV